MTTTSHEFTGPPVIRCPACCTGTVTCEGIMFSYGARLPNIATYRASQSIVHILKSIVKIPVLGTLIRLTFPSYLVVSQQ